MASSTLAEAPDPEPSERSRLQAALARCGAQVVVAPDEDTMPSRGAPLMALRDKAGVRAWLGSASATEEGTEKLVESLADHVERPEFLERLVSSRAAFEQDAPRACTEDVTREDFWKWDEASGTFKEGETVKESQVPQPPPNTDAAMADSFVMVEHEHVVEAVATFIAHFVASHPEAMHMPPKQLQKAVSSALRDMRKSRVRKVLSAGRKLHRWAVWSYGAFRRAPPPPTERL